MPRKKTLSLTPTETSALVNVWLCPNCGQWHFADEPPEMCAFCSDFTTWVQFPVVEEGVDVNDPLVITAIRLGAVVRLAYPGELRYPRSSTGNKSLNQKSLFGD